MPASTTVARGTAARNGEWTPPGTTRNIPETPPFSWSSE